MNIQTKVDTKWPFEEHDDVDVTQFLVDYLKEHKAEIVKEYEGLR